MMATRGLPLGIDFSGGAAFIVQGASEGGCPRRAQSHPGRQGHSAVRRCVEGTRSWSGCLRPRTEPRWRGRRSRSSRRLASAGLKTTIVGREAGQPGDRRRPAAARHLRHARVHSRDHRSTSASASGRRSPWAQSRRRSTTCSSRWRSFSFFGYDLSLNVVAALLTITGYSVNDTIVIFDRVRENLRSMRRQPLEESRQHQRQPDAVADDHHRRHDVPVGALALSVRR